MRAGPVRVRNSWWGMFRWPIAIGVASVVGLVAALIGDGAYDALSWLLLGGTAALVAVFLAI